MESIQNYKIMDNKKLQKAQNIIEKEQSKQEKEIYELAELLMQSENLEASAIILRDFAEKCYQEGAVDAQNDAAEEIREHYVEGGRCSYCC